MKLKWLKAYRLLFPSPSRGSYFSIFDMELQYDETKDKFPSPSRGSYFSIITMSYYKVRSINLFPSPSRGSYFSILKQLGWRDQQQVVSVPFPGILFLNGCCKNCTSCTWLVSVPFTGILFLNEVKKSVENLGYSRFRPLPGDLISQ